MRAGRTFYQVTSPDVTRLRTGACIYGLVLSCYQRTQNARLGVLAETGVVLVWLAAARFSRPRQLPLDLSARIVVEVDVDRLARATHAGTVLGHRVVVEDLIELDDVGIPNV